MQRLRVGSREAEQTSTDKSPSSSIELKNTVVANPPRPPGCKHSCPAYLDDKSSSNNMDKVNSDDDSDDDDDIIVVRSSPAEWGSHTHTARPLCMEVLAEARFTVRHHTAYWYLWLNAVTVASALRASPKQPKGQVGPPSLCPVVSCRASLPMTAGLLPLFMPFQHTCFI